MAVDVSKIPNNNKFDPVREAILDLQSEIEDTGGSIGNGTLTVSTSGTLTGSGTFTANQSDNTTITIGIDDSTYLTSSDISDFITLTDLSVTTSATPSGGGALSYDDTTGVFTFTPADAGTGLTLQQVTANGNSTTYGISTGNISVQPAGTGNGVVAISANSVGDAALTLTPGSTAGNGVIRTTIERGISFKPFNTEKVFIASDGNMNVYEKLAVGKTTAASTYAVEVDGIVQGDQFKAQSTYLGTTYSGDFDQYLTALQIRTDDGGIIEIGGNGTQTVQNDVYIKNGDLDVSGNVTADFFIGDGSQLTNIPGANQDLQDVTDNGATTTNSVSIGTSATPEATLQLGNNDGTRRILLYGANSQATSSELIFGDSSSDTTVYKYGAGLRFNSTDNILSIRSWFDGANSQDASLVDFYRNTGSVSTPIQFRYDSSFDGSVGIGTTSPRYQLDLAIPQDSSQADYIALGVYNGPSGGGGTTLGSGIIWKANYTGYTKRSAGIVQIAESNYFQSGLAFYTNGTANATTDWVQRMYLSSGGILQINRTNGQPTIKGSTTTGSAHLIIDSASGGDAVFLQNYNSGNLYMVTGGGKVGVNTTSPSDKFQIDAPNSQLRLRDTDDGTYTQFSSSGNLFAIRQNSTTASHFWMNSDGDVGLGTNSPSAKLHAYEPTTNVVARFESGDPTAWIDLHDSNSSGAYGVLLGAQGNDFLIAPSANEKVRVTNAGDVGIGTASPVCKLHIADNTPKVRIENTFVTGDWTGITDLGTIEWYTPDTSGNAPYTTGFISNVNETGGTLPSGALSFGVTPYNRLGGAVETFRLKSEGTAYFTNNLGIGTTSPQARLHAYSAGTANTQEIVAVLGSSGNRPVLQFSESTAGTITSGMSLEYNGNGSGDTNYMVINSVSNVPRFTVMSGGNVGIGTTSPSYKLHVNGDAKVETNLTIGDTGQTNTYLYLLSSTSGTSNLRMGDTDTDAGAIIYSNNSNLMTFRTNAGNRVFINSSGFMGVGYSNPASALVVKGNAQTLELRGDNHVYMAFYRDNATRSAYFGYATGSNDHLYLIQERNANLYLGTNGSVRQTIFANGRVAIGSSSANAMFQVGDGTFDAESRVYHSDGAFTEMKGYGVQFNRVASYLRPTAAGKTMYFGNSSTANTWGEIQTHAGEHNWYINGSFLMRLKSNGLGVGTSSPSAKVHIVDDTPLKIHTTTNAAGAKINFSDHAGGSYAQNGTIEFVHANTQSYGQGAAFKFYSTETMAFHVAGTGLFTGDITAFYSDMRLKTKLGDIQYPIEKIQALNGFYYEPNEIAESYGYKKERRLGLSAQEVKEVFPEAVSDAAIGDGYMSVDYAKLVPALVEAIKEQQKQIDELKARLNA